MGPSLRHAGFLVAACMWDLVPRSGMEPRPPELGAWSLTTGPPGKSLETFFFWLCWVLISARGLSLVAASRRATLHCGGFSCCGARALDTRVSVVVACGLQ